MFDSHPPQPLKFSDFESQKRILDKNQQGQYLINYLGGLGAKSILIEPNYFDRDYLAEFSAFYSTSAYGYKNICQRIHFFSNGTINRELFEKATGDDRDSIKTLNGGYLGFCVLRPIQACFGKTVLKWYPNKDQNSQRIIVKRNYTCHVAGVELSIEGLAWQQQDTGVGACATIALWSALQSSAFDDFHSIPTTAEITKLANKTASLGARTFPSEGLRDFQLYEAIKELKLSPMVQHGNVLKNPCFTKERLMSSIASYIRSGFPVIILGDLMIDSEKQGSHAICCVGFRNLSLPAPSQPVILEDSLNEILYIHDDNIGPNARFKITEEDQFSILHPEAPNYNADKQKTKYRIIPRTLVVATHNDIRTSPKQLYSTGFYFISVLYQILSKILNIRMDDFHLSLSTRFIKLTDYIHGELGRLLKSNKSSLSKHRLYLWEKVRPMSAHIGLVRIGLARSSIPLLDVLYDTTDSNLQMFTYIPFNEAIDKIIKYFKIDFNEKCF